MANKLILKAGQIKALQKKHGIANLMNPGQDGAVLLTNVEVLTDIYFEGSRNWEKPPTVEEIDDKEPAELMEALQSIWQVPGKPETPAETN